MMLENPDTLILNLTFLGTVGIAFLMFLVLFLLGVITLVLAGIGRLAAVALMALFGWHAHEETLPLVRLNGSPGAAPTSTPDSTPAPAAGSTADVKTPKPSREWRTALKPARREPSLPAPDWARAVAEADARAMAKAQASLSQPASLAGSKSLPRPEQAAKNAGKGTPGVAGTGNSANMPRGTR